MRVISQKMVDELYEHAEIVKLLSEEGVDLESLSGDERDEQLEYARKALGYKLKKAHKGALDYAVRQRKLGGDNTKAQIKRLLEEGAEFTVYRLYYYSMTGRLLTFSDLDHRKKIYGVVSEMAEDYAVVRYMTQQGCACRLDVPYDELSVHVEPPAELYE